MKINVVDGYRIRNTVDIEFSMIADRSVFAYVPKGEVWIEKYYLPEKAQVLAYFRKKMSLARKHGYERAKEMLRKPLLKSQADSYHKKRLGSASGAVVWLVDGARVRGELDAFFCFGGHHAVYGYVPKGEIWLDDVVSEKERPFILTHEAHELALMKKGYKYADAHDFANAAEKMARRKAGVGRYAKD